MNKFDFFNGEVRRFYETPQDFIPLHIPTLGEIEKEYLNRCIDSTFVSSVGPFVNEVEAYFTSIAKSHFAIACVNGTAALHLCLLAAGVSRGDIVITQPFSFVATANAIAYCGATISFVDIHPRTLSIDSEKLMRFLEADTYQDNNGVTRHKGSGQVIKACVVMHTFGMAAHIAELKAICEARNIILIEDAAEAVGSFLDGVPLGTFADYSAFSFNGNKTITAGGGGIVLCRNQEKAQWIKHISTQAKKPHPYAFFHDEIGYNYRMPNLNAALLMAQISRLPSILKAKKMLASHYFELFSKVGLETIPPIDGCEPNYWLIIALAESKEDLEHWLKATNDGGIMTRPGWELLHILPMYKDSIISGDLNVSLEIQSRLFNVPSTPPNHWL